ncbi:neuropeptide CCHamide-1 receptor-like [Thrips palmi]|uniref:Neuropeptide CCHamide-1 receptor-like n=1 Tax=Thrips palmi TaxID=161013 RepID=A0A6P8ZQ07_THRPL|nr:neuropeptide CCHamide-1 receptor-like [Thrips palmi]
MEDLVDHFYRLAAVPNGSLASPTPWGNFSDWANLSTSEPCPEIPYEERPETYFVPVIFAIIFLVGVLGNGTLICMFVSDRNMRNEPNTFIFSLACGDLLVILTAVPFVWVIYIVPYWPFGLIVCRLSETVKELSIGVSVFTLTALSAARYFPVVYPMRARSGGRSAAVRWSAVSSVAIWIVALGCAMPVALNAFLIPMKEIDHPACVKGDHYVACFPFPMEWSCKMAVYQCVIYYAVPLTIIFVFYALMAQRLFQSAATLPGEQEGHHPARNRQVRARRKVAKMVLAFVLVFWACFTPHQIFALWFHCAPDSRENFNSFWNYFRICAFCLKFLNSCANPVALYCVSGMFRKKFQRYLGWLLRGGRRRRSSNSLLTSSGTMQPRRASKARTIQRTITRRQRTGTTLVTTAFVNGGTA